MQRRLSVVAIVSSILAVVIAGFLTVGGATAAAPPGGRAGTEREGAKGGNAEAEEQTQHTQERLDAVRAAKAAGTLRVQAAPHAPPSGWAGERVISPTADDWEPAIAADPNAPYVYLLATRYTGPTACGNQCPLPYHVLKISTDGGATWGADRYLCSCRGVQGQFDPEIEVVPSTGAVYAAWMNGYNVVFSKSSDHGQTWSPPVPVYGNVSWNDKPVLAVSDNGNDVYIAFNGPTGGDPYIAQSHDAGATWTQTKIVDSKRYIYAFDGDVLPNGTVVFSETSLLYANTSTLTGQDLVYVYRSTNVGATWSTNLVDTVEIGPNCTAAGCPNDYYPGHSAVSADANGNLVLLYDGATVSQGNESIWTRRSTDGGATWSGRQALSTSGEMGDFPSVESRGAGDVRAWYMQTNGGNFDAWNTWYRSSTDGGVTWTAPVKISDVTSGASYKTANGFLEPYGDYGETAITSAGKTIATWGEGNSYTGPGGVWFNRQT
ncbi:MAG: hypothetical protein E6G65_06690 [Actinobacteria bacterium]|nr:MAG: hypothetical protein E6G65_06690 [Actinomycetota bacterium]